MNKQALDKAARRAMRESTLVRAVLCVIDARAHVLVWWCGLIRAGVRRSAADSCRRRSTRVAISLPTRS
jgi:hypothetical protein